MLPGNPSIHMQVLALLVQKYRDNPRAVLPLAVLDDIRQQPQRAVRALLRAFGRNHLEIKEQIKALYAANQALEARIVELEQQSTATQGIRR
jgi:hypothetical protein